MLFEKAGVRLQATDIWTITTQNVEYARSLLLRLEHEIAGVKVHSRKQLLQTNLQQKRDTIKKLNKRLRELDRLDTSDGEDEDGDNDEDENDSVEENNSNHHNGFGPARTASGGIEYQENETNRSAQNAAGNLSNILRSRKGQQVPQDTAVASGNSANLNNANPLTTTQASTTSLFSTAPSAHSNVDPTLATTEKVLSHNRAEEEVLTQSLLSMAQALKSSARQFQSTLETDKEVLGKATEGLDTNAQGMDKAGQRMGQLRRRTSGWAWWRHISLYVWIAGLWVALVMVFMLPKLRL